MDLACFVCLSNPNVPEHESEPVSDDCPAFAILLRGQYTTLPVAGVNKYLDPGQWLELVQRLAVRLRLIVVCELEGVIENLWTACEDQLRNKQSAIVLKRLLAVLRGVHLVDVNGQVDVEGLDDVVLIDPVFL